VDIRVFGPFHHLATAIVTITPPDETRLPPVLAYTARDVLDDGSYLRAFGRPARSQDRHDWRATPHMVDVHGGKAALVLVGIPERQLLAAMRRAEGVINVEDFRLPRPNGRAELIDKGSAQPCSFHLARRVLQTRDGRLRSERIRALGAPL